MKIKIIITGGLDIKLSNNQEIIEGSVLNIQDALEALIRKHSSSLSDELLDHSDLRKGLALLVNGRNVLSLTQKYYTFLKDKDEIIITNLLNGG